MESSGNNASGKFAQKTGDKKIYKAANSFRSLKLRFIAYSLTAMLLVAGALVFFTTGSMQSSLEQQYQQQLNRLVVENSEELRMVILSGQSEDIQKLITRMSMRLNAISIRLLDASGSVVASYNDETRSHSASIISYQHALPLLNKNGKTEQWQVRVRVWPDAFTGLVDTFIFNQILIMLLMAAAAVVGTSFAIEVTIGRRIVSLRQLLQRAIDKDFTVVEDGRFNDEFSEIVSQMITLAEGCQKQKQHFETLADITGMVCFLIQPSDESIILAGDTKELLNIDHSNICVVNDLIAFLSAEQASLLRQHWLELRRKLLEKTDCVGRHEFLWQLASAKDSGDDDATPPAWVKIISGWSNVNAEPVVYGVISDVTEKKTSKNGLQVELESYRSSYENLPVGFWRSCNDRFISMNHAMAKTLGYSSPQEAIEQVQSISHQLYMTPVDRSFFFDELRKREQMRSLEMRFRRSNGNLFWAAVYGRIFYEGGKEYCEGCFIDITDKRLAEEKLRLHEEVFRQSLESGNVVAWQFEPVGKKLLLFGAFDQLLGGQLSSDSSLKDFCKIIYPEDLRNFKSYFDKPKHNDSQKNTCALNFRICRPNTEKKIEIYRLRIISSDAASSYSGSQKVFRGLLIDASDLAEVESYQHKSVDNVRFEGMDTAELFTSMSHEIRTPLSAIIGYSELLAPLTENIRVQQYASSIIAAGRTLINIINSIHDLVRLESGQVELIEGSFSISDLFAEIDSMFIDEARRKGLDFSVQVDSEVPPLILSDETRLREVLINLVSNAVKYTNQGSVSVRVALSQSLQAGMVNLLFTVEDTGIGIECDNPEEIFDPLYRHKHRNKFGGTGLGLAICLRLVKLLQGSIKVKTELQRGTRFDVILKNVKLPDQLKDQSSADFAHKGLLRFSGQKIMVADDTASNRELIAEVMRNAGLTVFCASDGNEAVELAKKELPELIFMDLRMPQKDGVCAARELRCIAKLASVPIIAVTATNSFAELEELKGLFDGFIIKPVSLLKLFSEAGRFLSHEAAAEKVKETEFKLPPEAFEQLSSPWKLCEIVAKDFTNKFALTDNAILVDDLLALAERVRGVAIEHSFNILTLETEALIGGLQNYDINIIKKSRGRINKIFSQLLKVYSRR